MVMATMVVINVVVLHLTLLVILQIDFGVLPSDYHLSYGAVTFNMLGGNSDNGTQTGIFGYFYRGGGNNGSNLTATPGSLAFS